MREAEYILRTLLAVAGVAKQTITFILGFGQSQPEQTIFDSREIRDTLLRVLNVLLTPM